VLKGGVSRLTISDQLEDDSPGRRIDSLDGLRAIAILLILLAHLTPNHNSTQGLRSLVFKVADIGWSGVDLFFVLSGFLITGILLRSKASNRPLRHFLIGRILRILPAHYLVLFIVFLLLPFMLHLYPVPGLSAQVPYWFYLSNMFSENTPQLAGLFEIGHFWTLAVEVQFYALWPLVIYRFTSGVVWRVGLAALILVVIGRIVAVMIDLAGAAPLTSGVMGWLPFRADGLIVGSLIAVALHTGVRYEQVRSGLLVTLLVGSLFAALVIWFDKAGAIGWGWRKEDPLLLVLRVILPCALSLLFGAALWVSLQRNKFSAFLGNRLFKRLALYSYGIYIVHYLLRPVFHNLFGPQILVQWTGGQDGPIYLYFVIASSVSFILAMASYHLVEIHFLRLKPSLSGCNKAFRSQAEIMRPVATNVSG
jgi:peptidoglycan/LPS O-acetylase OafA/YrhL